MENLTAKINQAQAILALVMHFAQVAIAYAKGASTGFYEGFVGGFANRKYSSFGVKTKFLLMAAIVGFMFFAIVPYGIAIFTDYDNGAIYGTWAIPVLYFVVDYARKLKGMNV